MAKVTAALSRSNIIETRDALQRNMQRVATTMQKRAIALNDGEAAKLAGFAQRWIKELEQLNLFISDEAIAEYEAKMEARKVAQAEKLGKVVDSGEYTDDL